MNESTSPIRINLVEDVVISEAGLRCLLEQEQDFEVLQHVQCGPDCKQLCVEHDPDILLMVMNYGEKSGLECVRKITNRYPDTSILALCMVEDPNLARRLLDLGVKGVICSHTPAKIFFRAIREIARGGTYIDTDIARAIATLNSNSETNPFAVLTLKEYEIACMMLNGLSQKEIGKQLFISPHTVANHHSHILKKLHVSNHIELTKLAIRYNITTC